MSYSFGKNELFIYYIYTKHELVIYIYIQTKIFIQRGYSYKKRSYSYTKKF